MGSRQPAAGIVVWQCVQPSEQFTHHDDLVGTVGKRDAFDEPRHEDSAAIEV
jgi:hypothetical protein